MACSTTTLTGVDGKFSVDDQLVARITQWEVNPTLDTSMEWGDSDGGGYTLAAPGRKGCSFDTEGKFDTDSEVYDLFQPGDKLASVLWINASTLYWDFPCALCKDFSLSVNVDTQEVIGWSAEWKADGVFYYPGQSGATARTLPS